MENEAFGSQKIDNKTAILIFVLLSGGLALQVASSSIQLEANEDTQTLKDVILGVESSLFAIVFIILGIKKMNIYVIAAYGGLLAIIFPLLSSITLFLDPVTDLAQFYTYFVLSVLGWFLGVITLLKKVKDKELAENALPQIKKLFVILVIIAIWLFALYLIVIDYHNQISGM